MDEWVPPRVRALPRDEHDHPIPWWTPTTGGVPDWRGFSAGRLLDALRHELCWTCGIRRGAVSAVILTGPTLLSRLSTEPPSHTTCAEYAARACPFLTGTTPPREGLVRPVVAVWATRDTETYPTGDGGLVVRAGPAEHVTWWRAGRPATYEDADAAITAGWAHLTALTDSSATLAHLDGRRIEAAAALPEPTIVNPHA